MKSGVDRPILYHIPHQLDRLLLHSKSILTWTSRRENRTASVLFQETALRPEPWTSWTTPRPPSSLPRSAVQFSRGLQLPRQRSGGSSVNSTPFIISGVLWGRTQTSKSLGKAFIHTSSSDKDILTGSVALQGPCLASCLLLKLFDTFDCIWFPETLNQETFLYFEHAATIEK